MTTVEGSGQQTVLSVALHISILSTTASCLYSEGDRQTQLIAAQQTLTLLLCLLYSEGDQTTLHQLIAHDSPLARLRALLVQLSSDHLVGHTLPRQHKSGTLLLVVCKHCPRFVWIHLHDRIRKIQERRLVGGPECDVDRQWHCGSDHVCMLAHCCCEMRTAARLAGVLEVLLLREGMDHRLRAPRHALVLCVFNRFHCSGNLCCHALYFSPHQGPHSS